MTKKEVVKLAIEGKPVPYVPWAFGFTQDAAAKLKQHYGPSVNMHEVFQNHIAGVSANAGFGDIGNGCFQDRFGVVWDRSIDKDIGNVKGCVLPKPTLDSYKFPDPLDPALFARLPEVIKTFGDHFIQFSIGFSLYERAWTLRGMENLMMDFIEHPDFVHDLLRAIADHNIAQIKKAVKYDIDAVHFGDDWGQQTGLQMGPRIWHEFIKPELKRMYRVARKAGKYVTIHSCGKVQELFDDLIEIGLNCFNPFQPEVMDVEALIKKYRGRLAFHGGLSTQKTLPYGTAEDVRRDTQRLLDLGRDGGYIFAPAHATPKDVPLENMLAFIDLVTNQPGFKNG
ncbi:MAG: uroporphyrinogen decarboxylase family protein [Planctomycetota bacterium]